MNLYHLFSRLAECNIYILASSSDAAVRTFERVLKLGPVSSWEIAPSVPRGRQIYNSDGTLSKPFNP